VDEGGRSRGHWAYRKGPRYGTLILDHERRRPVDLFEGRTALDLANWLRQHPGSQIITRDRSAEYATAITETSPHVQQVADRPVAVREAMASVAQP
jgi:transposase